ncbi:MAG TPA: ROK family protein, partial [Desulfobaccales bacterium]
MMAKDLAVIGIDMGGTNVRLALVSPDGEILARWERATATMPDQEAMIATLAQDLEVCGQEAHSRSLEVKGVGLGIPGRVLPQQGLIAFVPNIPALNDCPLVARLQPRLAWPVFLENDANLFALGEHWLGAGVGHRHLLGITLGTGVGGGLIL